jgi:hypothetical protein
MGFLKSAMTYKWSTRNAHIFKEVLFYSLPMNIQRLCKPKPMYFSVTLQRFF